MKYASMQALESHISAPRFQTYLVKAEGDKQLALALYQWNIRASAAVTSSTGMVEVQLRNTIDRALRRWNSLQIHPTSGDRYHSDWLDNPASPLKDIINPTGQRGRQDPPTLRDRAKASLKGIDGRLSKPNPSHDDLVAGLTFGSWRWILPSPRAASARNDRVRIWNEALAPCFSDSRTVIYGWVDQLWFARNRASHLEPFLDEQGLTSIHRSSIRLLNSMNPMAAAWFAGQRFIPDILELCPDPSCLR